MKRALATAAALFMVGSLAVAPPVIAAPPAQSASDGDPAKVAMQAYALYQAERWDECIATATRAYELYPAPTLLVMKARAQAKLGRLLDARGTYERAKAWKTRDADPPAFSRAVEDARSELATLAQRIPTVTLVVRRAAVEVSRDDVRVAVNGRPQTGALDRIELDPGHHVLEVSLSAETIPGKKEEVDLRDGESRTVAIDLGGAAAPRVPEPPDTSPTYAPAAIAFGASGASAVVGAVLGAIALGKDDELAQLCGNADPCSSEHEALGNEVTTFATTSTVLFGVAGAAAIAGLILVIVPPGGGEPDAAATLRRRGITLLPAFDEDSAALTVGFVLP